MADPFIARLAGRLASIAIYLGANRDRIVKIAGKCATFLRSGRRGVPPPLLGVLAAGVLLLLLAPGVARAQFAVCNQSLDVANVAVGRDIGQDFQTEGWWTIGPNQCANVIRDALTTRYVYVFAQDVFGRPLLSGTVRMCISRGKFVIRGIADCWSRGEIAAGFIEIDTQRTERWTLFLSGLQ